jgi:trehalose 6-phosphate phosphatase
MSETLPAPPLPSPGWAWFLDIDGTLIEIADTPSAIHIPPELPGLLQALADRHGGAVALVSGRTVENIARLVAPFHPPAAGLHGLERRLADGRVLRPDPSPLLDGIRRSLSDFAAANPGVILEDKGLSLALHYRLAPHREAAARAVAEAAVAGHPELRLQAGKMVFEIRPRGADKGGALRAFMAEPPFAGRVPVFVGDDVTDEDGFKAANALGGISVMIGPPRPTAASFRLADVAGLRRWLLPPG